MSFCLHDGEEFSGPVFSFPIREQDGFYTTRGSFCSLSCALAWALDSRSVGENCRTLFNLFIREVYHVDAVIPAGPRELLRKHGGQLSLQEFRELPRRNQVARIYDPQMVPFACQQVQMTVTDMEDGKEPEAKAKPPSDNLLTFLKKRKT